MLCRAIAFLKDRGYVQGGQQVAIVQSGRKPIWRSASTHAIQVCQPCGAITSIGLAPF